MQSKRMLCALAAGAALAAAGPATAGAAVQVGSSGWQWGNPLPQGNTIRSMSFAGLTGYATGDFGTLLKTVDGGATWSGLSVGSFQNLTTVQALNDKTVIAGGGCVARRSDDGGQTFSRVAFVPSEAKCKQPLVSLSFVDPKTGWLLLADGTVTQTSDGGDTYTQRTAVPGTSAAGGGATPTDVSFISATTGFAISSEGKIYQSTDAGQSWKVVQDTKRKIYDITFVDALHGFAVGQAGLFMRTADGGATWTPKDVGAGAQDLTGIRCADLNLCIMATASGTQLVRTPDAGETATLVTPSTDKIFAAAFASPTQVAAAGANGASVVSVDGGLNFAAVGGRLTGKYSLIRAGGQQGTAFAPGDNGSLAVTADGGKTWARGNVATSEDVRDVSFPSAQTGYALDTDGGVFKTTNGAVAWKTLDTGTTAPANAIFAPDANTVLTIGGRGVRRSTDGGDSFSQVSGKPVVKVPLDNVDRAGSAIVAWGSQDVIMSTDKGKTWRAVTKPGKYKKFGRKRVNRLSVNVVDFVSAKAGFLLDDNGRVWRTNNGGKSWKQLLGVGEDEFRGMAFSSASAGYLVVPRFGDRTEESGFLMRTSDGGATWHPQFVINSAIKPFGIAAPGGGVDYLLGGDSALLSSTSGGDAGSSSTITLNKFTRKLRKRTKITITGKLTPAVSNQRVTVSYLRPGGLVWEHQTVNTAATGTFTTSWTVTKGANSFVAQWAGDFKSSGDGSPVLTVSVGKKK
jgi:photosystem II stability/assembly factor-like uncharacterized protein